MAKMMKPIRNDSGVASHNHRHQHHCDCYEESNDKGDNYYDGCFQIISTEDGHICGPNETGEVCIKGPMLMKGYLNRPKESADMIDSDGFLHTGMWPLLISKKYTIFIGTAC